MSEPSIVVANREHLWWLLIEAAQLEHMIMCQYLYAEFSLKDAGELTAVQAEAVGRWRATLRGIAVEEMLHLALVANLTAAIGAAPTFGRPNFPQRSGYFPAGFQLDLLPFGEQALRHFLYLGRPEGMELEDAHEFVPAAPGRTTLAPEELMPRGQEYTTIGHLYRGLEEGLRALCDDLGEQAVFVGSPRAQATPELFRWPQLVAVTDLKSALAAIETIIEQGEGSRGDWREAHYGRFLAIWQEYRDLRAADPAFEPARPVVPGYLRQPYDIAGPVPLLTDPGARGLAELAVVAYELVLHVLTRFFTHTDESDEQLGLLVGTAIGLMADVLRPLASAMTRLPSGHEGRTAGFAFEMYYAMTNTVPWREPSWALLHERTRVLVERCAEVERAGGAPAEVAAEVAAAGRRAAEYAERLAAHVPARLRPTSRTT
ncbi:ferritin-like protein [Nonomuraea sp. NPDC003804]|uniref:ferritin-like domain-containing protein n=1 Tax=Nonomuraea sp. NPDC003804 TaxID=3154547 RepID=UPI0033A10EA1